MLAKLTLAFALAAAAATPTAAADGGPLLVSAGGTGIVRGTTRYIPVNDSTSGDTELLAISARDGSELNQLGLVGQWGLPYTASGADGLSRDGKMLVLADNRAGFTSPSAFMLVDLKRMQVVRTITLHGYFSFDALSPDASRMYLIEYTRGPNDLSHYIVRGYDLRTNTLLPGRIADRTQKGWVMEGSPVTRTWSADGRWVYTLYTYPGGYPFVHALDTVRGVAHCIRLPWEEDRSQNGLYNLVLDVHDDGRTLAVHWRSGRPWLDVAAGTWRISYPHPGNPWLWLGCGVGGGLALLAAVGLLLRRRRSEELQELAGQELGLA